MSLVVEYRQRSEAIKLIDVAAAVPELSLSIHRFYRGDETDRLHVYLLAEGESFERLEGELEGLDHLLSLEQIATEPGARLYHLTVRSTLDFLPEDADVSGVINDIRVEPEGLYITGYISDRSQLIEIREFLADRGMEMQVERLYEPSAGSDDLPLSPQQLEALSTAHEMGYFAVPSRATQAEVAEQLGITTASLSERLNRAQQRLIQYHLEGTHSVSSRE